jgi:hypothetical protein
MPHIDLAVIVVLVAGAIAMSIAHWRRAHRGWRLAALIVVSIFGVALTAMMAAHCVDVVYKVVHASRSMVDGAAYTYNWRSYSLLLFGALLVDRGVRTLRAVLRFSGGDEARRRELARHAGFVLLLTLPIVPVHSFFGILMSAASTLALAAIATGLRPRAQGA